MNKEQIKSMVKIKITEGVKFTPHERECLRGNRQAGDKLVVPLAFKLAKRASDIDGIKRYLRPDLFGDKNEARNKKR